jgi:hypothetical protein
VHPTTAPGSGHCFICQGKLTSRQALHLKTRRGPHGPPRRSRTRTDRRLPHAPPPHGITGRNSRPGLPLRGLQAGVLDQASRCVDYRQEFSTRPLRTARMPRIAPTHRTPTPNRRSFPRGPASIFVADGYFCSRWLDAALAAVPIVVIETIAPSATNAANTTSLILELRWRFSMLVRWFMSSSLARALIQDRDHRRAKLF